VLLLGAASFVAMAALIWPLPDPRPRPPTAVIGLSAFASMLAGTTALCSSALGRLPARGAIAHEVTPPATTCLRSRS
jgi:hypothetical protein